MMATASGCQTTERLLELLLGDDAESRRVEAHLKECEACSQEWERLSAWRAPPVAAAPQPDSKVGFATVVRAAKSDPAGAGSYPGLWDRVKATFLECGS